MRLAAFINENVEKIIFEWESFAKRLIPSAKHMTPLGLRNHIRQILTFIMEDIESPQTGAEQVLKSHGEGPQRNPGAHSAAETHAALRLAGGFNMDQMVSEYRALRASVVKLWHAAERDMDSTDVLELIRFNEALDQALTESISHYTKKLDDARDMFIGILSHDLRNPLGAVHMSAELIPRIAPLHERQRILVAQIVDSTARVNEIVDQLLDITKARFGSGLSVIREPMDMGFTSRQLVDEMRAQYPHRRFTIEIEGETKGNWDKARIGQVFSNLLGNAVQYGFRDSAISVAVKGKPEGILLSVHNEGVPIAPDVIRKIFESLTRANTDSGDDPRMETTNLGLGLYISREIVIAHGGTIWATSSEKDGTVFTAQLPWG